MGYIYITSFGSVENRLLLACAYNVKEVFKIEARVSSVPFPTKLGFDPLRNGYSTEVLLNYLKGVYFPQMVRLVVLVGSDLYGGEGFDDRSVVVSVFGLSYPREDLLFLRVLKEVNYKLGRTFGLDICLNESCVMNFPCSTEVEDRERFFCSSCSQKLRATLELYS